MSWKQDFRKMVIKLAQDPKIKVAMEGIRETTGGGSAKAGMMWQVATLSARFIGRKRTRVVGEVIDVITFLVTLSLILKQNIFDRPEVKAFLSKTWGGLSAGGRKFAEKAQSVVARRLRA